MKLNECCSATQIHPTAIVDESAEIGAGSVIGPYSIIGANVKIGANNYIAAHVVIEGFTTIGDGNRIFQFASIGAIPQDLKYHGEPSQLVIGSRNIVREYVTLQPGTENGGMLTSIGDQNLFMANCHVGHDCHVGSGNVLANSVAVAGHVKIGNRTILGGLSGIHQFVRLGELSLVSAGAMVGKDLPPYCMAQGDHAGLAGINKIGLQRAGFSPDDIMRIRKLYRQIFYSKGLFKDRMESAAAEVKDFKAGMLMLEFMSNSQRGILSLRSGVHSSDN